MKVDAGIDAPGRTTCFSITEVKPSTSRLSLQPDNFASAVKFSGPQIADALGALSVIITTRALGARVPYRSAQEHPQNELEDEKWGLRVRV